MAVVTTSSPILTEATKDTHVVNCDAHIPKVVEYHDCTQAQPSDGFHLNHDSTS